MAVIGVSVLPVASGTSNSPSSVLLSHLSHLYPSEAHRAYHVDHRLFVSTSSLLPGADPKGRQFTQMLTTSHAPNTTFVTTVASATTNPTTIRIPVSSQDSFSQLLITKLQPQWAHRQSLSVEGATVSLPLRDGGAWTIRLGDLRVAAGGGRSAASVNVGTVRGILFEISFSAADESNTETEEAEDIDSYAMVFRDLVKSLFQNIEDYKLDDMNFAVARVDNTRISSRGDETDLAICHIYTGVLRGSRS